MRTISVPFTFSGGRLQNTDDPHKIARQEIINVLMTEQYERVMAPGYGASTTRLLFSTLDNLVVADYKEEALAMLNSNTSNCTVMSLSVLDQPESVPQSGGTEDPQSTLYVNVTYKLNGDATAATMSISVVNPDALNVFSPI